MTRSPEDLRDFAVALARSAMATIVAGKPEPAASETKVDAGDWVTPFDRAIESATREAISARFPNDAVVGEEFGSAAADPESAELTWFLDPIDGTMNYVHGVPWVAFSLAAVDARGVVAGVVADAYRNTIYSASRGFGAYIDDVPARCSRHDRIAGGLLLTEWSRQAAWPGMDGYLKRVSAEAGATRIMGSCALALAMVGVGQATGAVLPGHYNPWDVYAGGLIATEGGAVICGRDGPTHAIPLDGVMAATPGSADEIWQAWRGQAS